jgi:hypothetical protein
MLSQPGLLDSGVIGFALQVLLRREAHENKTPTL